MLTIQPTSRGWEIPLKSPDSIAMEMLSATPLDFDFHSAASSPYATAPASPQPFGQSHHFYNLSAPTSPTQSPPLNSFFREINRSRKSLSAIPFGWEASPGVPKHLDTSGKSSTVISLYMALLEKVSYWIVYFLLDMFFPCQKAPRMVLQWRMISSSTSAGNWMLERRLLRKSCLMGAKSGP